MEIILIRHGKPTSANNPELSASEYTKWIRRYNASDVSEQSRPQNKLKLNSSNLIISSDLKRAIHSAEIYTGEPPDQTFELFREMEIPRYKFPFRLKAWTWVYLCRAFWMLGLKGPFESYKEAKSRAELGAEKLIELAQEKGSVVLFGHGYMNLHIRKFLINKGWELSNKSNDFWGETKLKNHSLKAQ